MDTRKVQRLGPSTLAITLPAEWARQYDVEKGNEIPLHLSGNGTITVSPESAKGEETGVTITVDQLDAAAVERAIVAQYVLGRRIIRVESEGTLEGSAIGAVYDAESQLMGVGVVEETPERITVRCSADPEDFDLDNLLTRLENTGGTMRSEAVKALAHGNPDLARRALNRERQANKIFVLLLRLIFTAHRSPNLARAVGLDDGFPLVGYRSVTKNLELTADNAQDVAEIVLAAESDDLDLDGETVRRIRDFTDRIDEIAARAVRAVVERDYETTIEVRELFAGIAHRESEILSGLPEMENDKLLGIRELLVALQQTAQYAVRNAEIAANLALREESGSTER